MRHGGVGVARRAVDDLVERAVAAAGIQPDRLAGGSGGLRDMGAVAGRA